MVDLSFLEKFTKNNPVKMKRYISMYLDATPKIFDDMKQYLKNEDWEQLSISAHSLKPQAELIGIYSLKEVLVEIENNVKSNQVDNLESLFEKAYHYHLESEAILKTHSKDL